MGLKQVNGELKRAKKKHVPLEAGVRMLRVRVFLPLPQGALQEDQSLQVESTQSVGGGGGGTGQSVRVQDSTTVVEGQARPPLAAFCLTVMVPIRLPCARRWMCRQTVSGASRACHA